ncbi:type II secretion system F family protein [Sporosalibacterium faouarense]|uniref:type II secretion system F family protein n=1 Tax=Sporosalibacterium faouarense TaxID=516123 RepID=UPI00192AA7D5|nr:type II secretion system F family protein [Sporosalibacterium faouarense]
MPNYKYTALDKLGKKVDKTYSANSREEVLNMLRQNGYYPVNIEIDSKAKDIKKFSLPSKVKTKDIAIFCRQFYAMLNAGVPIINCLEILRNQTENKKLKKTVGEVYEDVQKGMTFSESLKNHRNVFPDLLIHMVEAGEVSGNLDIIMDRMASHFEKENKINNKIKSAMTYPIILGIVAVIVVIFLLTVVMPTFIGMFEGSGVPLPLPTRILLSISDFLKGYWYLVLIITIGLFYILTKYMQTDKGKYAMDRFKFRIPVLSSTTKKVVTSRFTRTMSTLLASGVSLIEALDIVSRVVGNKIVSDGLQQSKEDVRKGINLAEPIGNIGIFPPMVVSMIKIGEESGALDDILDKTANFYDEEVETAMQRLTTLLEPIMIVFMAVIIGFIVIAMMLPMFDMVNTIDY